MGLAVRGSRYGLSLTTLQRTGALDGPVCAAWRSDSVRDVHDLDVVGIGNALVDVISHHDDRFLDERSARQGIDDADRSRPGRSALRVMGAGVELSGGSAANTMTGVASFGGRAAYIGKVAADDLGDVFRHDLRAVGVAYENTAGDPAVPTGRCLIVVTPDAQRTMNTFLGVVGAAVPEDVDEALVARASVVYLEGYLFDRDGAKEAYRKASAAAHAAGGKVSLTLSDSFCVDRHRQDFRDLVAGQVDLLFCQRGGAGGAVRGVHRGRGPRRRAAATARWPP